MSFERRLEGIRVLVPRPRERTQELCFLLEDEGATVIALPLLELVPPTDPRPFRAAVEQLQRYPWIALASAAAVEALAEAAREAQTETWLGKAKLAAVGPRTAKAIRDRGLSVRVEAPAATGASLAEALAPLVAPGEEVLFPAAEEARRELPEGLLAAGVAVVQVAAYRADRAAVEPKEIAGLQAAPPRVILFGSPRTADALLEVVGASGRAWVESAKRVAIGPTTAAALAERGLPAAAVASEPTPQGLLEAAVLAVRDAG